MSEPSQDFDFEAVFDSVDGATKKPAATGLVEAAEESELIRRRLTIAPILALLTRDGISLKQSGTEAHCIAYALSLGPCRNQTELAERLQITPGRVSQILKSLTTELNWPRLKTQKVKRKPDFTALKAIPALRRLKP